uniref:U8-Hypotoxin-Hsp1f_1 n=1 Tax=Hypochilus sp. SGP-2016 TaxID=1905178 RepID=A0A482ZI26_9ARAC
MKAVLVLAVSAVLVAFALAQNNEDADLLNDNYAEARGCTADPGKYCTSDCDCCDPGDKYYLCAGTATEGTCVQTRFVMAAAKKKHGADFLANSIAEYFR